MFRAKLKHMGQKIDCLSESVLRSYVEKTFEILKFGQLQSVWYSEPELLVIEIYTSTVFWLICDLNESTPFLIVVPKNQISLVKSNPKPTVLFLNAHAKGKRLLKMALVEGLGRVVEFIFGSDENHSRVLFELIPKSANLMVELVENSKVQKQISWRRPRERKIQEKIETVFVDVELESVNQYWIDARIGALFSEKKDQLDSPPGGSKANANANSLTDELSIRNNKAVSELKKIIEKKQRAIEAIITAAKTMNAEEWYEFGEKIKSIPIEELANMQPVGKKIFDPLQSRAKNMEKVFDYAKLIKQKIEGGKKRIEILKSEIEKMQTKISSLQSTEITDTEKNSVLKQLGSENMRTQTQVARRQKLQSKGELPKTRQIELNDGLRALIGKTAKDNILLLRQARPWDLWIHLKDEASAHGIIFKQKGQSVSDQEIIKVGEWIYRHSKRVEGDISGIRIHISIVECRFVKIIKGDKLGRVSIHKPRNFSFIAK